MTDVDTHLWVEYARELYLAGMAPGRPGYRPDSFGLRILGTDRIVDALVREFGASPGPWTTALARRAVAMAKPGPRAADGLSYGPLGFDALHQVAAIRMGLAMATGDVSSLTPAEVRLVSGYARERQASGLSTPREAGPLRRVAEAVPRLRIPVDAGRPDVPAAFGFGFAWARRSGTGVTAVSARAHAGMLEVEASSVPVACRLATPDGGFLDVRWDDIGFLRPVTSPGTWDLVDVATFLSAARDGARWADNPFVPVDRDLPVLTLAESTVPGRDGTPSREAARDIIVSVGSMHVINGVVYRRCPAPEACVTLSGRGGDPAVTWRIPGHVEATDDMGCLRLTRHEATRFDPMDASGEHFRPGTPHAQFATLDLPDAGALAAMASEALGRSVRVAEPGSTGGFEVVFPEAWPYDPYRVLDALAGWIEAVPGEYSGGSLVAARASVAEAVATARREGGTALPDLDDALDALSLDAPVAALWGRSLRARAEGPAPGDEAMASFAP